MTDKELKKLSHMELLVLLVTAMSVRPAQAISVPSTELNNSVSQTIKYDWNGAKDSTPLCRGIVCVLIGVIRRKGENHE